MSGRAQTIFISITFDSDSWSLFHAGTVNIVFVYCDDAKVNRTLKV